MLPRMSGPPASWIATPAPAPPSVSPRAALTIASTGPGRSVMSAATSCTHARPSADGLCDCGSSLVLAVGRAGGTGGRMTGGCAACAGWLSPGGAGVPAGGGVPSVSVSSDGSVMTVARRDGPALAGRDLLAGEVACGDLAFCDLAAGGSGGSLGVRPRDPAGRHRPNGRADSGLVGEDVSDAARDLKPAWTSLVDTRRGLKKIAPGAAIIDPARDARRDEATLGARLVRTAAVPPGASRLRGAPGSGPRIISIRPPKNAEYILRIPTCRTRRMASACDG